MYERYVEQGLPLAAIPHIPKKSELISPANEIQSYIYFDSL